MMRTTIEVRCSLLRVAPGILEHRTAGPLDVGGREKTAHETVARGIIKLKALESAAS